MTQDVKQIKLDRMRYTKDKLSSNLALAAIVFNALYFVSIYGTDVGTYYYNWVIGASVIYNLLFMLFVFLSSESMKNRKDGYSLPLLLVGAMQIVRMFYIPAKAVASTVIIDGIEHAAMEKGQYVYVIVCLAISAACCIIAAVSSYINNRTLAAYMRSIEN